MQVTGDPVPLAHHGEFTGSQRELDVRDGAPGDSGERDHRCLITLGERPAVALLGQVEVAEDGPPDPDRRSDERVHRRMTIGQSEGSRVLREIVEAQGARMAQDLPEDPSSRRELTETRDRRVVEPMVHEAREPLRFLLVDDAERAVARVDESARGDDDALEDRIEVEVLGDGEDRLHEPAEVRVHPVHGTSSWR